jgi:hypothetical protein
MTDIKASRAKWAAAKTVDLGTIPPLMMSPFGAILKRAVRATPNAIGGAFADAQGEMIDGFTTRNPTDWALLTAHYGVVLSQIHAAFGTWHFGGPEYFIAQHEVLHVVVYSVMGGYYALMAVTEPAPLGQALISVREAARLLRLEML